MAKRFDNPETLALIRLASKQDQSACAAIYERHYKEALTVCHKILGNLADAEEAAQDSFQKVNANIQRFKRQSTLKTWIHRIAINTALMHRRRMRTDVSLDINVYEPAYFDKDLEAIADRIILQRLLKRLPRANQTIMEMRLLGYSFEEVAKEVGLNTGTTKSRYCRTVELLKEMYARERMRTMRRAVRRKESSINLVNAN